MIIIETKRLVLRQFVAEDLNNLFQLYSDPEVRQFIPDGPLNYEQTKAQLDYFLKPDPEFPGLGLWATILKNSNRFVGRCGLLHWTIDGRPEVEVAYMLTKEYWGQGFGTEAAQGIMDYGFDKLHLPRLVCLIEHGNLASIRVAEKIGMKFEKEGKDEYGPFMVYAKESTGIE